MAVNDTKVWVAQNNLRVGRSGHAVAVYDRWIFQAFGTTNQDVEAAYLNTDGSLNDWKVVGCTPVGRTNLIQSGQIGQYWFVMGGQVSFQPQPQVYVAKVGAGVCSSFREDTPLPVETSAAAICADSKNLFVIGGFNGTFPALTTVTKVWRAQPQNGRIPKWEACMEIPSPVDQCNAFVYGEYLYVFGGQNDNSGVVISADNWRARIFSNGDLGNWEKLQALSMGARTRASTLVHKGKLYIIGGIVGSTNQDTIEIGSLTDAGPGRFERGHNLPIPLRGAIAVSIGNHIVILGGGPGAGNTVFTANI